MTTGINLKSDSKEDTILFLEIIALLHDIGKLSTNFIHSKAIDNSQEDTHALLPLSDNFPEIFRKIITIYSNNSKQKPFEFNPFTLICSHHGCERCQSECSFKHKNPITTLLRLADRRASEEEKGFLLDSYRQPKDETYFSNPFGKELLVFTGIIDECRNELWKIINKVLEKKNIQEVRNQIIPLIEAVYTFFPSETRRPGNDLSLWDHSFTTSTYFKIALYEMLINGKNILSTQKIPVVFLKIKKRQDKFRELIENKYCAGNLILSFGGYHIYAIGESFLKNESLPKNEISESFFSLIPSLEEEIENLDFTGATSVFIPDYRSLFSHIAESTFTQPLTRNQMVEAKVILNKVIVQNCLREKREIEEKIKSISRHIKNLENSGLKEERKNEYLLKLEDIYRLNANLNLLSKLSETFNSENSFLRLNLPSWEVSVLNLYQDWLKTDSAITFDEYALYNLSQRKPSVSSCSSLVREVEKQLAAVKKFLLNRDCYCWESEGVLYIKEPLTNDLLLESKKIINRLSGKSLGLIPIYWYKINKKPFSPKKRKHSFHKVEEWKWGILTPENFLLLQFEKKETIKVNLARGDSSLDIHRLYRKNKIGRFIHLSDVRVGDSILWFFPLERY